MNFMRTLHIVMFMIALIVIPVLSASAGEVKYELKPAATIKVILNDYVGKRVILRLESGEELEGTVAVVGDNIVHISKLSKRDFFDAFVGIDKISAIIIRVR